MRDQVQRDLDALRVAGGLYVASPSQMYHYVWIRDICYVALSELHRDNGRYEETYHSLLDIFRKYDWKLKYHAKRRPYETFEYIHPRYTADTQEEVDEPWGNAQNDAIGAFLFGIGEGLRRGKKMLRDEQDVEIVSLLVQYLTTLEYWHDGDNGIWEEHREVHASSVGACVAGLLAVRHHVDVPMAAILQGMQTLYSMLPNESVSKSCDLALLSLIYPYRLLPFTLAADIVNRIETQLLRPYGVIRYAGDKYYADDGQEAQWCMGLPWLGLCHMYALDNEDKALSYLLWATRVMTDGLEIPEIYLAVRGTPNENTPLGWAQSLWLILHDAMVRHH